MLLLETLPTFEKITKKEFEYKLPSLASKLKIVGSGYIVLEPSDLSTISSIIFYATSILKIYLVVASGSFNKTEDLYEYAVNAEWDKYFAHQRTFAVYNKIKNIDRKIVGRLVGQGVVDYFKTKYSSRPPVNLRSPEIKIFTFLINDQLFLGIDLLGYYLNGAKDLAYTALVVGIPPQLKNPVCSLYSKELCEFVNNYFMGTPKKERIVEADLLRLNIDQKQLYELTLKANNLYKSIPTCKRLESPSDCPYILADLVSIFPSKQEHTKATNNLFEHINEQTKYCGLIVRRDTPLKIFDQFKVRKIAQLLLKGIPSYILWVERK